jgi:hypothetical protein
VATCEVCGNEYDKSLGLREFQLHTDLTTLTRLAQAPQSRASFPFAAEPAKTHSERAGH